MDKMKITIITLLSIIILMLGVIIILIVFDKSYSNNPADSSNNSVLKSSEQLSSHTVNSDTQSSYISESYISSETFNFEALDPDEWVTDTTLFYNYGISSATDLQSNYFTFFSENMPLPPSEPENRNWEWKVEYENDVQGKLVNQKDNNIVIKFYNTGEQNLETSGYYFNVTDLKSVGIIK